MDRAAWLYFQHTQPAATKACLLIPTCVLQAMHDLDFVALPLLMQRVCQGATLLLLILGLDRAASPPLVPCLPLPCSEFAKESRFYFPHNVDFRGRAYPMHPHLNHLVRPASPLWLRLPVVHMRSWRCADAAHTKPGTVWLSWWVPPPAPTHPPISPPLPPLQGADLSRGLLQFAEGKPLGEHGMFWLYVQVGGQ